MKKNYNLIWNIFIILLFLGIGYYGYTQGWFKQSIVIIEENVQVNQGDYVTGGTNNPTEIPEIICTDSDGGKDYFNYGEVHSNFNSQTFAIDECFDGKLLESYCRTNGAITFATVDCPNGYGCYGGECLEIL